MIESKPKRTGLIIGGVIVLIILLAGAAFVGGQLLNQQQAEGSNSGFAVSGGPGGGGQQITLKAVAAKELPNSKPDVAGLFASRKDNSIFVTQGDNVMVTVGKDGSVYSSTDGNGQQIEIVVTTDTKIYIDVTQPPDPAVVPASGNITVQQQVAPGSIDEISANTFVSAWGDRRGDRLIATILLYEQPQLNNPPGKASP